MRDPKRIPIFLDTLQALWEQHPDLRFHQLLSWIAHETRMDTGLADTFYVEDDVAEKTIVRLGVADQDPRREK